MPPPPLRHAPPRSRSGRTAGSRRDTAAVHLGLRVPERRWQVAKLAEIAASAVEISVMLGDFNDWPWRGVVRRALAAALPARTRHRTYPARWPLLLLDRVYCRPPQALLRSWTDPSARGLSDHLPVIADIRIKGLAWSVAKWWWAY